MSVGVTSVVGAADDDDNDDDDDNFIVYLYKHPVSVPELICLVTHIRVCTRACSTLTTTC